MTGNEFNRVRSMLKGTFPRLTIFDGEDLQSVVFNALNRFDSRDILSGVKTCVEECQYPPTLREIIGFVERAASIRKDDERRINNAHQTFAEAVHCTKCNDSGYTLVTFRKPAKDPSHCFDDDHPKYPGPYDYTEIARPCSCAAARERFPLYFLSDEEWLRWVEDQRRKGKAVSADKPGMKQEMIEKECGEVYTIRPGRRPQVFTREDKR